MENKNMAKAQEELAFIKGIIEDSREKLYDNGSHLILWGVLVSLGQCSNYLSIKYNFSNYLGIIWIVLMGLGWVGGFILGKRYKKAEKPGNFASKIAASLWLSGGISMTIFGFAFGLINGMFINPTIATILGTLFFTTGALYKMKWFSKIGFGWWIMAIVMFNWRTLESFLLFAFIMILFMVVPGILLNKRYKSQLDLEED